MRHSLMVTAALLTVGACMIGPRTGNFAPATGPQGIAADLRLGEEGRAETRVQGELLEMQDTALVLLSADRVVYVPIGAIEWGKFQRRGVLIAQGEMRKGTGPWLKAVSRFPAGMSPEIRTRLLAAYGQTQPDIKP